MGSSLPGSSPSGGGPPGGSPPDGRLPDAGRDRDAAGRARNARPRDGLGRPLARDAAAGAAPGPAASDEIALPPATALETAQGLLDAGRPFHAHEVLEASWKAAPPAERDLWQGLAQLAVGLTHALRGNSPGAAALLRRGAERVARYRSACPHGVDAGGLADTATGLAAQIDAEGLSGLPPGRLRLRLRADPAVSPGRTR